MIHIKSVRKTFGEIVAVDDVSLKIEDMQVFGLVGTNGAGKSTLLRLLSGILRQDSGSIEVCGQPVYDRPDVKREIFFIPDDPFFFRNGTAKDMRNYFKTVYPAFDAERFDVLLADFRLDPRRKIRNYSRGMKKQLAIVCGICSNARYLLCDETFDGLDPVMRQAVKSLFANDMAGRGLTPVIASHNLRELEDICDHVGLLHSGGLLLSHDLADLKVGLQKVQCVFADEAEADAMLKRLPGASSPGALYTQHSPDGEMPDGEMSAEKSGAVLLRDEKRGRLHTLTLRASQEEVLSLFGAADTVFFEILPLTLEEIFISETEVVGYDIKNDILG